jgi:hypothetical protein
MWPAERDCKEQVLGVGRMWRYTGVWRLLDLPLTTRGLSQSCQKEHTLVQCTDLWDHFLSRFVIAQSIKWTGYEANYRGRKMTVFFDVAPYILIQIDRRFRGASYLLAYRSLPDEGGSKRLWNVWQFLRDYTTIHKRRQSSSYSPPWEREISPGFDSGLHI